MAPVDAAIGHQGASLGRRTVSDDLRALLLELLELGHEVALDRLHLLREPPIEREGVDAPLLFVLQEAFDRVARVFLPLDEEAQRASVDVGQNDVVQEETVTPEELVQRRHREVAEVLVVDGVELPLVDEVEQVGTLDDRHTVVGEQQVDAVDESVEVLDVREDVVAQKHVSLLPLLFQLARQVRGEEGVHRLDTRFLGHLRGPLGGIDPQHRDPGFDEVPEHVAVVAGGLDHQRVGPETAPLDDVAGAVAEVLHEPGRDAREVGVVLTEEHFRIHRLQDLHQGAVLAEGGRQGDHVLGLVLVLGAKQAVGQRRRAEVEECREPLPSTGATSGDGLVEAHPTTRSSSSSTLSARSCRTCAMRL